MFLFSFYTSMRNNSKSFNMVSGYFSHWYLSSHLIGFINVSYLLGEHYVSCFLVANPLALFFWCVLDSPLFGSSWTLICYSLFWSKNMVICLTIYYHDQCFLLEKDRSKYPLCFATTSISCFCSKDWRKDCCFCFYSRSIIVDAFVFSFDHCG